MIFAEVKHHYSSQTIAVAIEEHLIYTHIIEWGCANFDWTHHHLSSVNCLHDIIQNHWNSKILVVSQMLMPLLVMIRNVNIESFHSTLHNSQYGKQNIITIIMKAEIKAYFRRWKYIAKSVKNSAATKMGNHNWILTIITTQYMNFTQSFLYSIFHKYISQNERATLFPHWYPIFFPFFFSIFFSLRGRPHAFIELDCEYSIFLNSLHRKEGSLALETKLFFIFVFPFFFSLLPFPRPNWVMYTDYLQ